MSEEKNGRENREAVPLTPHGGQTHGGEAFGAPDLRVSQKGLTNPILLSAERPPSGKSRSEVSLLGRKEREGLELPFTVVFGSLIYPSNC